MKSKRLKLEAELIDQIEKLPEVEEVVYSSKEQELDNLIKDFGDELSLFEQSNPLHNVLYVKATDPQQTANVAKQIEKLDHIHMKLFMVKEKLRSYLAF